MMCLRALIAGIVLLATSSVANAQSQQKDFESMKPFAIGRVTGQVNWGVENCGGKLSDAAMEHSGRALLKDRAEFMNGIETGSRDMEGYKTMLGNTPQACSLAQSMYGRNGKMPGLWD